MTFNIGVGLPQYASTISIVSCSSLAIFAQSISAVIDLAWNQEDYLFFPLEYKWK